MAMSGRIVCLVSISISIGINEVILFAKNANRNEFESSMQ